MKLARPTGMKIVLTGEDSIRFEPVPGPLTIEAPKTSASYSPFQMLGSALAVCTHSVLASWASHAEISSDDLSITVSWTFVEKPRRVGGITMDLHWPSLPAHRAEVARRAALICPIHATLSHSPSISITSGP